MSFICLALYLFQMDFKVSFHFFITVLGVIPVIKTRAFILRGFKKKNKSVNYQTLFLNFSKAVAPLFHVFEGEPSEQKKGFHLSKVSFIRDFSTRIIFA